MSDVTDSGVPPTHGGKNVGGLLNRKVGGMPVKWLLLGVIVVVAGWFTYRHFHPASTISTTDTGDVASTDTTGTPDDSAFYGAGSSVTGGTSATSYLTPTGTGITTNPQWVQNASNGLVGTGAYSGSTVIDALNTYVNGGSPTPAQTAIINAAISAYGAPPESITATLPVAATTATPTGAYHTYATLEADTINSVIQKTYGQVDPTLLADFHAINPLLKTFPNTKQFGNHRTLYLPLFTTGTLP